MKWIMFVLVVAIAFLVFLVLATATPAQTSEVVMTPPDIQIRFLGEADWVSGGDAAQTIFSVDSISYSSEALSTDVKHTTKLDTPETWEAEMFRIGTDPFRKAIFIITIHEATNRVFELRVANRYAGEDVIAWSLPTEDKVIGKPGKAANIK